ncbi:MULTISPECIES: ThiF family adenylyltransferase [Sphingomonas]|uniref:ThiF family adenylyltransferase n=1 Tax=Sphingomonas molluscorum TaxID=418184 RepID=A0ABU8Q520_9SPHN|nr:molybdopterin/thiamine biosynthesis adenylyltransferase [Sphingomonas sp. JUb134]
MIWWLSQPSRARSERLAIAELEERYGWLSGVKWEVREEARLAADFEIEHLGQAVAMTITFPSFFPDVPPQVRPREEIWLSGHQYGVGGELCLEYRPDNWEPTYTGAMMIESAHRLLIGETPSEGVVAEVDTAHRVTTAQEIRNAKYRFMLPAAARDGLNGLPLFAPVPFEMSERYEAGHWLAVPRRFGEEKAPLWSCDSDTPRNRRRMGFAFRLPDGFRDTIRSSYDFLEALGSVAGYEALAAILASSPEEAAFLIECGGDVHVMSLAPGDGKRPMYQYRLVNLPDAERRLANEYHRLAGASVAIVGCGSVGSKIGASLARAGVGRFVLVDGDILYPGNLVRNDLDWGSVGLNKPDAVSKRIRDIRPSTVVETRRVLLGGQESSAATDAALVAVGKCDVIIDATAEGQIFNLCGAVARNERKIMVWGEVFAGGIGGLVMRLRPDVDPVPHAARRQIMDWCTDHGRPPPQGDQVQYGLALNEGSSPLIADDADVGLVAGHMARYAIDSLLRPESVFPQSAYAIGFQRDWIFDGPFDTWPIELRPEGCWGPQKDDDLSGELAALAAELFPDAQTDRAA